jgi:outer membrane receptor for ferrienterochelin and colicins
MNLQISFRSSLIMILLALVSVAFAVPVSVLRGVIVDNTTGSAIQCAGVVITETGQGTIADRNGYFEIKSVEPGTYTVRTSLIGYGPVIQSVDVKAGKTPLLRVKLKSVVLHGQEIVVTATRNPRVLRETPVATSVVTRYEIAKSQLQNTSDAVGWVPGVNISGGAPGAVTSRSTVMFQGLPAQYSLVLVDGRKLLSEHIHTGVNLNVVPVDLVERIEVVKGPASALYGSDAMAGVVNIVTRIPTAYPTYGLRTYYGSHNTFHLGSHFSSSYRGLGYLVAYNKERADGQKSGDEYDRDNVRTRFDFDPTKDLNVDAQARYYRGDYSTSDDYMGGLNSTVTYELGPKSHVKASVGYQGYHRNYVKSGNPAETDNNTASGGIEYAVELPANNSMTAGVETRWNDFERLGVPYKSEWVQSAYLQDEVTFLPFKGVAGCRVDHHPEVGTEINPKASLLYMAPTNTDLRVSVGRGFRAPSLQDRFEYHYDHGTWWRDGNADLKAETSTSFSAGIEQRYRGYFMGTVSVFKNSFTNMIAAKATGELADDGDPVLRRENIRKAYSQGVETEMRVRPIAGLDLRTAYTYLDSKDETNNTPLEYNPTHSINAQVRYTFFGFTAFAAVQHAQGRSFWDKTTNQHLPLDDYTLINASVSQRVMNHLSVFCTVQNVFDQDFETYEEGKRLVSKGRLFMVGLSVDRGI